MCTEHCRIVLIENHPLLRDGLIERLNETDDLIVAGVAHDADAGFAVAVRERPDLVVVNMGVPGRGAFVLADDLSAPLPKTRVVFLSEFYSDILLDEAMRLHVAGFFLTNEPSDRIIAGLRTVCCGGTDFSAEVAERLVYDDQAQRFFAKYQTKLSGLTSRQLMVLRHISWGTDLDEVARLMSITRQTVHSHKHKIMQKLDVHDRVELMRYVIREGLAVP